MDERARQAFTLIELMIVVAIIGILASIAIPQFHRFQLKSKTSEAKANIAGIKTAQIAYYTEQGMFASAPPSPATYGGVMPRGFVAEGPADAGFDALGWAPEGSVFFQYAVVSTSADGGAYTIDAAADLDGNGTPQVWGYVAPDRNGTPVAGTLGCTAVWNGASVTALNTVGACSSSFGSTEF